jgi:antitoxin (DNA-binding transcriptional repressor) of toxin-antitoxin stability system
LLDRALAGEEVTITRRGKPIARIAPVSSASRLLHGDLPRSPNDVEWLKRHMVKPAVEIDSVEEIRRMRDEYRY